MGPAEEHALVSRVAWRIGEETEGTCAASVIQAFPDIRGLLLYIVGMALDRGVLNGLDRAVLNGFGSRCFKWL